MLLVADLPPASSSPVPIYTPGGKEALLELSVISISNCVTPARVQTKPYFCNNEISTFMKSQPYMVFV